MSLRIERMSKKELVAVVKRLAKCAFLDEVGLIQETGLALIDVLSQRRDAVVKRHEECLAEAARIRKSVPTLDGTSEQRISHINATLKANTAELAAERAWQEWERISDRIDAIFDEMQRAREEAA